MKIGRWKYGDNVNVSSYIMKTRTRLEPIVPIQNDSVLVFVNSKVTNYDKRQDIRETWAASASIKSSIIFHVSSNESLLNDDLLREEHAQYGDILQNDLLDSYQNLTCKL